MAILTAQAATRQPLRLRAREVTLWPNLTGGEVIDLLGRLRGGLDARRRADLLERFELDPTKKARAYSKGNRQKVALVAALSSDVELLLLDEPTAGLDPLMDAVLRECIVELRSQGRTALLLSHMLSEVEALADRVTIIRDGRRVEVGSLAEMRPPGACLDLRRPRRRAGWPGGAAWGAVRLALRRDRIVLPVFIVLLVVMVAASAAATIKLYPDEALRVQAAVAANTTTSTSRCTARSTRRPRSVRSKPSRWAS